MTKIHEHKTKKCVESFQKYKEMLQEQIDVIESVMKKVKKNKMKSAAEEVHMNLYGDFTEWSFNAQNDFENICPLEYLPLPSCDGG
jgi:Zn-dependent oligopeptidase